MVWRYSESRFMVLCVPSDSSRQFNRRGMDMNSRREACSHWSESRFHEFTLLVFPNDSAHSFSWRGMDVNPAEASLLISQSHVCPRVCYVHFLSRVTLRCVEVKPSWHCVTNATGTLLTLCMEMFSLSTRSFVVESHGGAFHGGID